MSSFTVPLIVSPQANGRHWVVMREFRYHVGAYPSTDVVRVPAGYITDFASVPRFFWRILPPWGKYGKAAVVHDWLCDLRDRPSAEVHRIFLEAMTVLEVNPWKRMAMYLAVRCCGPRFDGQDAPQ